MIDIQEQINYFSNLSLQKLKEKMNKFNDIGTASDADAALSNLCFYHCVRDSNVMYVVQQGVIKTKNNVLEGEFTNNYNDFFQGFDKHIAMSIGAPWVEYGPHAFVYGIEHISDSALFYFMDPWQLKREKLSKQFLTKKDFVELAKIIVIKKLIMKKRKFVQRKRLDSVNLLNKSFKRMELKNDKNLKVSDALNYFSFSYVDYSLYLIGRFWIIFVLMIIAIAAVIYNL